MIVYKLKMRLLTFCYSIFNSGGSINYGILLLPWVKIDSTKLNPFYITGFSDAECSFMISLVKRPDLKTGWSVQPIFKYDLPIRDLPLLEKLKTFFGGVGNITVSTSRNSAYYSVNSTKEIIEFIIPHFDKYPLVTKKRADFELFKSAIKLINKSEHLNPEGLKK